MKTALKYYVGINVKSDRRQVFGAHAKPTARSHGKHFSAVIGPFTNLRAALYVRDRGFNNPKIRCPADAERLCRVRSLPRAQRPAAKLKRTKRRKIARRPKRRTGVSPVIRRSRRSRRAMPIKRKATRRKNPANAVIIRNRKSGQRIGPMALPIARMRLAKILKTWRRDHGKATFPYWIETNHARNPVARLRSGQRQGDIFTGQREAFALVGERGTDHARRQAEKETKARDKKAFASRNQLDFETNPRRRKGRRQKAKGSKSK